MDGKNDILPKIANNEKQSTCMNSQISVQYQNTKQLDNRNVTIHETNTIKWNGKGEINEQTKMEKNGQRRNKK